MKGAIKLLTIVIFANALQSCDGIHPKPKDFIGSWKSDDGAIIELEKDSSFIAKQVNLSNIFFDKDNRNIKIDFEGRWEFTTDYKKKKIIKINSNKYSFSFEISGQGILERKPPWDLYIWIGDPDDMNKYEFKKVKK